MSQISWKTILQHMLLKKKMIFNYFQGEKSEKVRASFDTSYLSDILSKERETRRVRAPRFHVPPPFHVQMYNKTVYR